MCALSPPSTWAGWQRWRRCTRSWWRSRGRRHTGPGHRCPASSPASICSGGSPGPVHRNAHAQTQSDVSDTSASVVLVRANPSVILSHVLLPLLLQTVILWSYKIMNWTCVCICIILNSFGTLITTLFFPQSVIVKTGRHYWMLTLDWTESIFCSVCISFSKILSIFILKYRRIQIAPL